MTSYVEIIDDIGFFGPMILFILTIIMLRGRSKYFNVYLIFVLINAALNNTLKYTIKAYENTSGIDMYYIPSLDAQSVSFSTLYLYLVTKSKNLLISSTFISILSLLVRYQFKHDSTKQILAGIVVGSGVAYISYNLATIFLTYR
jgi:hypothetical protein